MSRLTDLERDYKLTLSKYRDARHNGTEQERIVLSNELMRIADQMERER